MGGDEDAGLADDLGHLQRVQAPAALVGPRAAATAARRGRSPASRWPRPSAASRGGPRAGRHVAHARPRAGDVLGPRAAAAADDLGALLAPVGGQLAVLLAVDGLVEAPAVVGEVAEVGIDAERQVGEVAQPRQHARHVVGRQAVDEQGAHAELVQAPRGAAELVALRAAPVLAEDAAHAVAAAAEAGPHRDARRHERLDGGERQAVADEGDGLQQDEVGRMVLEGRAAAAR